MGLMTQVLPIIIGFLLLVTVGGVPMSAQEQLLVQATETASSCSVDSSCCGTPNVHGLLDFVPQKAMPVEFTRIGIPNLALTCDCGKAIRSRYTPCLSLPLANESTYEAISFRSYLDIKVGGFAFTAPTGDMATDMCFAYSKCTTTFGIHLDSPLKFCWPNPMGTKPEGPICFKPTTFMFSDSSELEFKSMSGLWNGAAETSDPIPFRGELMLGGYFTIGMQDLGGVKVTLELYGKMLFAVDLSKPATAWENAFMTLFGGKTDLNKDDLPGFQFTFDAKAVLNFAFSPKGSTAAAEFNLILGGATLTMGVNMQNVQYKNGDKEAIKPYKGYTNGIYGCGYQSMSLPQFVPGLGTFFGKNVDWPEMMCEICFFFDKALSMRLRTTARISMFGGYFEVQYGMIGMKRTLDLTFKSWVFDVDFHLMVAPPSLSNPTGQGAISFNLHCDGGGTSHCATKIGNEIGSTVKSWINSAAKSYFSKNPFFLELEEDSDVESLVEGGDDNDIEDLLDDVQASTEEGWKKKKFKVKVKKIVKTVVKAVPVPKFSSSGVFVNVGDFQMSGSLPKFKFSMKVGVGIKIVSKNFSKSATVSIETEDPADLGNAMLKLIKSQVVDKMF